MLVDIRVNECNHFIYIYISFKYISDVFLQYVCVQLILSLLRAAIICCYKMPLIYYKRLQSLFIRCRRVLYMTSDWNYLILSILLRTFYLQKPPSKQFELQWSVNAAAEMIFLAHRAHFWRGDSFSGSAAPEKPPVEKGLRYAT